MVFEFCDKQQNLIFQFSSCFINLRSFSGNVPNYRDNTCFELSMISLLHSLMILIELELDNPFVVQWSVFWQRSYIESSVWKNLYSLFFWLTCKVKRQGFLKCPFTKKKLSNAYVGIHINNSWLYHSFKPRSVFAQQRWREVVFVTLSPGFTGKPGYAVHATFSK